MKPPIRQRLAVYHEQTEPLIHYYSSQNLVKNIPGRELLTRSFQRPVKP